MALTKIDLGTSVNDGTGTNLRSGGQLINDSFDQIDTNKTGIATNVADIATNVADIATNTAEIANRVLLQSKSFISPSTSAIINSDSAVYMDTDLVVAITPKSATSKLRVNAQLPFNWDGNTNDGFKLQIQKKIGSGAWTDILYGGQAQNHVSRIITGTGATNRRLDVSINTQIDSPGITDEVQFKVTFAPFTDTVTYTNTRMRMITVDEIEE